MALIYNVTALQIQSQNLQGETELITAEIEDSGLDDVMLLQTSAQLDLETYLDKKKHHKKRHVVKEKIEENLKQTEEGDKSPQPAVENAEQPDTSKAVKNEDQSEQPAQMVEKPKKHKHKKHQKHPKQEAQTLNQAKDNFDKDKNSVSDGDGNTQNNFEDFNKEVALNKVNKDKRAITQKEAEDAIPLEVKQAQQRKEQRHLAKLNKDKKLHDKATKLATEQSLDKDLALQIVKEKQELHDQKHHKHLTQQQRSEIDEDEKEEEEAKQKQEEEQTQQLQKREAQKLLDKKQQEATDQEIEKESQSEIKDKEIEKESQSINQKTPSSGHKKKHHSKNNKKHNVKKTLEEPHKPIEEPIAPSESKSNESETLEKTAAEKEQSHQETVAEVKSAIKSQLKSPDGQIKNKNTEELVEKKKKHHSHKHKKHTLQSDDKTIQKEKRQSEVKQQESKEQSQNKTIETTSNKSEQANKTNLVQVKKDVQANKTVAANITYKANTTVLSNTSVQANSTIKANKTTEVKKTVDAKVNQTDDTQNNTKEKHNMSYYMEQVNHVESGKTDQQDKKNATVLQPKVKSLETLAKEQAQEKEKKKSGEPSETHSKKHKKELTEKEMVNNIVSQIDTDDGNDLISSFIKGDTPSEGDADEETDASQIQI